MYKISWTITHLLIEYISSTNRYISSANNARYNRQ